MPSVSGKQHRFFEMIAHNPTIAHQRGIDPKVGKDFVEADKREGKFQSTAAGGLRRKEIKPHGGKS